MSEIKFRKMPDYGDLFPLEEFIDMCKSGGFIDWDGSGYYANGNQISDKGINPSDVTGNGEEFYKKTGKFFRVDKVVNIDRSFTHVAWFNQ